MEKPSKINSTMDMFKKAFKGKTKVSYYSQSPKRLKTRGNVSGVTFSTLR
jgi:hypothetical protein